jgi:hypothetical protein
MRALGLIFGCFVVSFIGFILGSAIAGSTGSIVGLFGALFWYLKSIDLH